MGCYETIFFECPNCGRELSGQSKSGPCILDSYHYKKVPIDVALDANRHAPFECYKELGGCGKKWEFGKIPTIDRIMVELTIEPA